MARLPTTRGMLHSPNSVVGSLMGRHSWRSDGNPGLVRRGHPAWQWGAFLGLPRLKDAEAGVAGLEHQDEHDGDAGQHVYRGVWQLQPALERVGGRLESAK